MSYICIWAPYAVVDGHMDAHSLYYNHKHYPSFGVVFWIARSCKCAKDTSRLWLRLYHFKLHPTSSHVIHMYLSTFCCYEWGHMYARSQQHYHMLQGGLCLSHGAMLYFQMLKKGPKTKNRWHIDDMLTACRSICRAQHIICFFLEAMFIISEKQLRHVGTWGGATRRQEGGMSRGNAIASCRDESLRGRGNERTRRGDATISWRDKRTRGWHN